MNIVFDFGAVLITWQPAHLLRQTFPDLLSEPAQAAALAHQVFGHSDWHAFDQGVLTAQEVVSRTARRLQLPQDRLSQLVHGIGERLQPIAETLALLAELRERRLAGQGISGLYFLSNMPAPYARELERRHEFLQWFDGGIFSADVQHIKPQPEIYRTLQARYALPPERIIFIDDLQHNVRAAQAQGWQAIHFTNAQALRQALYPQLTPHPT